MLNFRWTRADYPGNGILEFFPVSLLIRFYNHKLYCRNHFLKFFNWSSKVLTNTAWWDIIRSRFMYQNYCRNWSSARISCIAMTRTAGCQSELLFLHALEYFQHDIFHISLKMVEFIITSFSTIDRTKSIAYVCAMHTLCITYEREINHRLCFYN